MAEGGGPTARDSIENRLEDKKSEAARLLGDVIQRANALFKPVPIPRVSILAFGDPLEPYKIASVSIPVCVNVLEGKERGLHPSLDEKFAKDQFILDLKGFDHFDLCVPPVPNEVEFTKAYLDKIESWCKAIVTSCEMALDLGARYVVLNELGYPNFWPGRPASIGADDPRRYLGRLQTNLDTRLQDLAIEKNAVIIAGSYHDWATFENICHVYFPSYDEPCNHKKLTSARGVGEYIKVARGNTYPVYNIGSAVFCVLICSDAFDLNILFRQLCRGTHDPQLIPQVFFVPSFYIRKKNTRHAMVEACRQLSVLTGTSVVFTNHPADESPTVVFVCGEKINIDVTDGITTATIDPVRFRELYVESETIRSEISSFCGQVSDV